MVVTSLELAKVYIKKDQPLKAIETYKKGLEAHKFEVSLLTGISRIHELLNDSPASNAFCKKVLQLDNSHRESIATLGSYHFYTDQPEIALRFYRRLISTGFS